MEAIGRSGLTRSLVVAVRGDGASIPRLDAHPPLGLGAAHLVTLATVATGTDVETAVASVAAQIDAPTEAFDGFIADLEARGLLLDQPPEGGGAGERPDVPTGATPAEGEVLALQIPLMARLATDGRYEVVDHDGRVVLDVDGRELAAAGAFASGSTVPDARDRHRSEAGALALDDEAFDALVSRLVATGLAQQVDAMAADSRLERRKRIEQSQARSQQACQDQVVRRVGEYLRDQPQGGDRTKVIPIHVNHTIPSLALGLIFAYAKTYDGGRLADHYDFVPSWILAPGQLSYLLDKPAVVLVSNYVWSHPETLAFSARVRELSPDSVIIHGGPNTPKYPGDTEAYFRDHPHVDVTVRGEGEATVAELLDRLVGQVGNGPVDLSVLEGVEGISYRHGDQVVRNPDRDRIADLEILPSPYLTGLFDGYADAAAEGAQFQMVLETNRGCPYGCTFCDWGSATASRMRKFDTERVYAELEWAARNKAHSVSLADSNFGMMPRDVEIAEYIAELHSTYGYPKRLALSFAKSSVNNRKAIIQALVGAGIMTEGLVSLQTLSDSTLEAINRKNIKTEKYDDLATQFRRAGLPLWVELMLGLPGSTVQSFTDDLQDCVAREVPAKVYMTNMLVNSPMNAPDYKERFKIETVASRENSERLVVSTSTYTRSDREEMLRIRADYMVYENLGVLRQVSRFVHQQAGIREMDLYAGLRLTAAADPERWPAVALAERSLLQIMAPPVSWRYFIDEVGDYLVNVLHLPDDSALRTVLEVQHALLPARGRTMPVTLSLAHDFAAWHAQMLEAKESGHRHDWPEVVAPLSSYGPAEFHIEDPNDICNTGLGSSLEMIMDDTWDLNSPVSRGAHLRPIPAIA